MTTGTYWKDFRYEKNNFRFSVKRKALEDGTYYVSVTETAGYYKSLGKKTTENSEAKPASAEKASRRSTRDRHPVVIPDEEKEAPTVDDAEAQDEAQEENVISAKQQRKLEAEQREAERRELRLQQRREQEKRREEAKALREAEKLKKAEEKKQREEEKRLKREQ